MGALLIGWSTGAHAATYTVTNRNDNGIGSLRQAILDANATAAADSITFASSLQGTLTLTSGELAIQSDITIVGTGSSKLAISAGGNSRLFNINRGTVTISGLTLRNGRSVGTNGTNGSGPADVKRNPSGGLDHYGQSGKSGDAVSGGAVLNAGKLRLIHVVLSHNAVVGGNGGAGAAIAKPGASIPEDGYIGGDGGAGGRAGGGAIYNRGTLTVSDTSFVSNQVIGGDGGPGGNVDWAQPGVGGGGGNALGGAIWNEGTLQLFTTTFAGNSVVEGKGGYNGKSPSSSGSPSTVRTSGGHYIGPDVYDPKTYKAPVAQSLTIAGTQNQALRAQLQATAQGGPRTYSLVSALPDGLTLDTTTGLLTGTPSGAGQGLKAKYKVDDGFGTSNTATLTFNIDPATSTPLPVLTINSPSAKEGDSGTTPLVFTLTLDKASSHEVSVWVNTRQGTAQSGSDYLSVGRATVTFAPGTTQQTFMVQVKGDTTVEGDERFRLDLRAPIGATLATNSGTGTILNDDVAPKPPALAGSAPTA